MSTTLKELDIVFVWYSFTDRPEYIWPTYFFGNEFTEDTIMSMLKNKYPDKDIYIDGIER